MNFSIQHQLEDEKVIMRPLMADDFEELLTVASDPKIWEQHPNKNRWQREVFKTFFKGALESGGAYIIVNKYNGKAIGCTRFYGYNSDDDSILIGYTFYATQYWGKGINHTVKTLMLDYIFQNVRTVYFHIGAENIRSQIAIGRLGTTKIEEKEVTYFGEMPYLNYVYKLTREEWALHKDNTKSIY